MSDSPEMRPPYLRFERKPVEDRDESIKQGHYVARDIDFVHVTRPGSKDTLVKEAVAFVKDMFNAAHQGRVPLSWPQAFERQYKEWQNGETSAVSGTPIKGWAVLSPAQQQTIVQAGILTVEDLSQLSDAELPRIGMGSVSLRQKAQAWLLSAKDMGKAAETITALQVQVADLIRTVQEQSEMINRLTPKADQAPEKSRNQIAASVAASLRT